MSMKMQEIHAAEELKNLKLMLANSEKKDCGVKFSFHCLIKMAT